MNIRAYGFIRTRNGTPITGQLYFHRIVDPNNNGHFSVMRSGIVSGPDYGMLLKYPETNPQASSMKSSDVRGKGFFDVPGGLEEGQYAIHVHYDNKEEWAFPFVVDAEHLSAPQDVYVGGPIVNDGGLPTIEPPNVEKLSKMFTKGNFVKAFSYYGGVGAPYSTFASDFEKFANSGFGNSRIWVDWDHKNNGKDRIQGHSLFLSNGTPITTLCDIFKKKLDFAAGIGVSVDLTMHASFYDFVKTGTEGYSINAHLKAIAFLLQEFGSHPAVRIVDMANEAEARGGNGGLNGSPEWGHVSPARFAKMMQVARSINRTCLVSVSISGAGDKQNVIENYKVMFRDTKGEILLPHFPRVDGWGKKEYPNAVILNNAFGGKIGIHHQEPGRRRYHGQNPTASEFVECFKGAKAAGSLGCCFHTDAGFDVTNQSAWDRMDNEEKTAISLISQI